MRLCNISKDRFDESIKNSSHEEKRTQVFCLILCGLRENGFDQAHQEFA